MQNSVTYYIETPEVLDLVKMYGDRLEGLTVAQKYLLIHGMSAVGFIHHAHGESISILEGFVDQEEYLTPELEQIVKRLDENLDELSMHYLMEAITASIHWQAGKAQAA